MYYRRTFFQVLLVAVCGTKAFQTYSISVSSKASGRFTTSGWRRPQHERLPRASSPPISEGTISTNPVLLYLKASKQGNDEDTTTDDYDLQRIKIGDRDFWTRQKELIDEMAQANEASTKAEMQDKFAKRRLGLVGDTAYFGFFIFCLLWIVSSNPFVSISYSFGATMGLAYAYGLGKYVETVGASPDEVISSQGAGVGGARFAFLILLFVVVGKFRSEGLLEVPAIAGFFTYQLASLSQGMKEIND